MKTRELLDNLSKEARRLHVGQKLPANRPVTWELAQRVQADFRYLLDQPGVTIAGIAEAMGDLSRGPLSRFRNLDKPEDFTGDLDRTVRRVNEFMETMGRRKLAQTAKAPEGFVETEVARRMLVVIGKTIELSSMSLITSDAGRGKTLTLKAAESIHPSSIYLRVRRDCRMPKQLVAAVATAIGVPVRGTTHAVTSSVIDRLAGRGRTLLIDEAHQLTPDGLETVRDLHDEAGCPVVLAGTVRLTEAVDDPAVFFGQFSSRIALRYDVTEVLREGLPGGDGPRPLHSIDEIRRLYESDRVRFTADGRLLLTKLANLPGLGGLRLCVKVVQVAAAAAQGEPLDARRLLQVIQTLHGRAFSTARIEPAIDRFRLRVA
ncbi:MAG: AAA family ATPase [Planctomycetota bacterium]